MFNLGQRGPRQIGGFSQSGRVVTDQRSDRSERRPRRPTVVGIFAAPVALVVSVLVAGTQQPNGPRTPIATHTQHESFADEKAFAIASTSRPTAPTAVVPDEPAAGVRTDCAQTETRAAQEIVDRKQFAFATKRS